MCAQVHSFIKSKNARNCLSLSPASQKYTLNGKFTVGTRIKGSDDTRNKIWHTSGGGGGGGMQYHHHHQYIPIGWRSGWNHSQLTWRSNTEWRNGLNGWLGKWLWMRVAFMHSKCTLWEETRAVCALLGWHSGCSLVTLIHIATVP